MPGCPDLAIFVLTDDDDRQTQLITLPLAHAHGVKIASIKITTMAVYSYM